MSHLVQIRRRLTPVVVLGTAILMVCGLGVASAATGGNFILGRSNYASTLTTLTNTTGTPLYLRAPAGKAPLAVNNSVKVPNLNADLVDGLHASAFQRTLGRLVFTNLTLLNGWTGNCYGGGLPGFAVDAQGVVHFHGEMCGGSAANAFDLPAAVTPTNTLWLTVDECNGHTGRIEIDTNGHVSVVDDPDAASAGQDTCFTSLDGVTFPLPW